MRSNAIQGLTTYSNVMRLLLVLLAATIVLHAQPEPKAIVPIVPARKMALVIGNSDYLHPDYFPPIPAAGFDADGIASALRRLGFEVAPVKRNLGLDALTTEIARFVRSLRPGDLALLYYSGHGGSVGEENYLVPVDYQPPDDESLVDKKAYAMSQARDAMERSGARVRVLVFDACRSSLLYGQKGGEESPRELKGRPEGTLIAFASAHKQEALFDRKETNSVFTGQLLEALKNPDEDLSVLLQDVARQVYRQTETRQTPFTYGFLSAPLYLAGAPPKPPDFVKPDAAAEAWAGIRNSQSPDDFDDFARMFPGSELAASAKLRAAALRRAVTPVVTADRGPVPGQVRQSAPDGSKDVWIPPGKFTMGCSPGDNECIDNEKPARNVVISTGFWMQQTTATVGEWKKYRAATKAPALPTADYLGRTLNEAAGDDNLPAVAMTWDEAKGYCEFRGGRLPTEAEWEYAARAADTSARYGNLDSIGWYGDNSGRQRIDSTALWNKNPNATNYEKSLYDNGNGPHPVARKLPNQWNLYDMLGNVWQWTSDWYEEGKSRSLRGGSWFSYPGSVRVSYRDRVEPGDRNSNFGARCVGN